MPGSEFRVLPRLPLEYKLYKLISPSALGTAMTKGWVPVASVKYEEHSGGSSFLATQFLIAKGPRKVMSAHSAGPTPILMFPQPDAEGAEKNTTQVQQFLDRLALMSPQEVLALHAELKAGGQTSEEPSEEPAEEDGEEESAEDGESTDEVSAAMEELLGDDGSEDDDDE
jgi:hypothetical protein